MTFTVTFAESGRVLGRDVELRSQPIEPHDSEQLRFGDREELARLAMNLGNNAVDRTANRPSLQLRFDPFHFKPIGRQCFLSSLQSRTTEFDIRLSTRQFFATAAARPIDVGQRV